MATYSNNTTIKISAAVSNSLSTQNGTLYTAPALSYAIVQVCLVMAGAASQGTLSVGGVVVETIGASKTFYNVLVGPGQAVAYTWNAAGGGVNTISGVNFLNTP